MSDAWVLRNFNFSRQTIQMKLQQGHFYLNFIWVYVCSTAKMGIPQNSSALSHWKNPEALRAANCWLYSWYFLKILNCNPRFLPWAWIRNIFDKIQYHDGHGSRKWKSDTEILRYRDAISSIMLHFMYF